MNSQKLTPAALGGKQFEIGHAGSRVTRKVSVFCCALFLCVTFIIYAIIYIYIYRYMYIYIYI